MMLNKKILTMPFPKIAYLFILILLSLTAEIYVRCAVFNRYHPSEFEHSEKIEKNKAIKLELELLANHQVSSEMKETAKKAMIDSFTGEWMMSGDEANEVGDAMEKKFGGFWDVYVFEADFDAAYTTIRRSPRYLLWRVNNRAILIAQQTNERPPNKDSTILLRQRRYQIE